MEKSLKDVSANLSGKDAYITSLIKENDLLTNRVKIARNRLEKFKKEEIGKLEKLLHEKESEVEVLKEMLKGGSTQVRQKEKEVQKYKLRADNLERQLNRMQATQASFEKFNQKSHTSINSSQSIGSMRRSLPDYDDSYGMNKGRPNVKLPPLQQKQQNTPSVK